MEVHQKKKRLDPIKESITVLRMIDTISEPERNSKNTGKRRAAWLALAFFIFLSDQVSKWAILQFFVQPKLGIDKTVPFLNWYLQPADILPFVSQKVTGFFNLVMAWNTGVSFSMFSDSGALGAALLILFALAITLLFLFWMFKTRYHRYGIAYALVIGGALGNVIDRARFGAVIDFLDFHAFGYHWPAFNVADMAIVCGIFLLVIVSLFFDIQSKEDYRDEAKNS